MVNLLFKQQREDSKETGFTHDCPKGCSSKHIIIPRKELEERRGRRNVF